jgi:imidazolonepropionase-like amidohydrolase
MLRLGARYGHLAQTAACACHAPQTMAAVRRLTDALSRRDVLRAAAGAMAAATAGPALAAVDGRRLLLTNARVFDGRSPALREGVSVLLEGATIAGLPRSGETVTDAETIDCGGRVLMPGLIDAHWHTILAAIPMVAALTADVSYVHVVAAAEAERTVLRGFTTVRDVGGPSFGLKRAIDEGQVAGPRIFPSGAMISQTSGHGDFRWRSEIPRSSRNDIGAAEAAGVSAIADGVPEVLRRTREQLLLGASQIKIVAGGGVSSLYDPIDTLQFTEDEIRAAVAAAADWGTYVCAHVYTAEGIRRSVRCGVRSIEHGQLADEDAVRMMADHGIWWSIQPFLSDEDANPKSDPEQVRAQRMIAEGTLRAVELGLKHGVPMAFGTDVLFNPAGTAGQNRQLTKFARWLEPVDVLRMATARNAELLALSGPRSPYPAPLGVVAPGAAADLVLVDGDPIASLSLIADPAGSFPVIVKDGRVVKNTLEARLEGR